jgi:hypothetical protein
MITWSDFLMVIVAIGMAGYIAIAADFVAHDDLGFSREHIRAVATISAAVVASFLAVGYFGKKLRKPK